MQKRFWLDRWLKNQIGFHQGDYNTWLKELWPSLDVAHGSAVFVPLCGKSLDMRWLANQGHPVRGIELSPVAVEAYFEEGGEPFAVDQMGGLNLYRGESAQIYCGDFFELTAPLLRDVRAVFDRGALVAFSETGRRRYADHLQRVVPDGVQILLLTVEYDQRLAAGPPFAVHPDEVEALYAERCEIEQLVSLPTETLPEHFQAQGVRSAVETVYRLVKRD